MPSGPEIFFSMNRVVACHQRRVDDLFERVPAGLPRFELNQIERLLTTIEE
jgi:hypothetical protein